MFDDTKYFNEKYADRNRMIAIFTGKKELKEGEDKWIFDRYRVYFLEQRFRIRFIYPDHMKYHTSWDWLMSAIEKISDVPDESERTEIEKDKVADALISLNLHDTYDAVVSFIVYYNKFLKYRYEK